MIAYFDTSAIIPLLVEEPGSELARRIWARAEHAVSVRLVYAEARAALAQARRSGRVSEEEAAAVVSGLEEIHGRLHRIDIDDALVRRAGDLADDHWLRGYDAIHLASAERVAAADTVLVSGDHRLCDAARTVGLAVADISTEH